MNAHTVPEQVRIARSLLSLAKTQKRLAHEYRRWALEAEAAGNLGAYRKYRNESDRLWRDAYWHLSKARVGIVNG